MKKNTNFFERIIQILEYYGIKSINSFAKDYLNYDSSEKINRLRKDNANPSYEIIVDITNKFVDIDANWLLTGTGPMLRPIGLMSEEEMDQQDKEVEEGKWHTSSGKPHEFNYLIDKIQSLSAKNALLKQEVEQLKQSRGKSIDTIPYTDSTQKLSTSLAAEPAHK